jgi:hypothetical protein
VSAIDKTIWACQTFVIVVPTWLCVVLAAAAIVSAGLAATELYYRRKFYRATPVSDTGGPSK